LINLKDKKIALLYGGYSSEREISIKSGKAVENVLKELNLDYKVFDPIERKKFIDELVKYNPNIVFIALHGKGGEDGTIQGVLDFLNYKYTGSPQKASVIAMDKILSKKLVKFHNIPTPNWYTIRNIEELKNVDLNFPKVVKAPREGSSIGVYIVNNEKELREAVNNCFKYDDEILIEDFIKGREITIGILNGEPLDIIEIKVEKGFYDYKNKYFSDKTSYICPAEIEPELYKKLQKTAVDIYNIIGCKGVARVDFILDENGIAYFLEINTIPGLTDHSLVPKMAKHKGISFKELIVKIIEGALNER
jgi:D-alanine-D-alanine ligase